jgi:hypothetical protein
MPFLRVAVVLLALCVSTAASAKDVCLLDSGNEAGFVLKKLKIPKKPGDAVPVSGLGFTSTSANALPLSGTLIRDLGGELFLGLTRHFQRCLLGFVLDGSLNGQVSYDCNLDNVNDTTGSVTLVDCDTFFGS